MKNVLLIAAFVLPLKTFAAFEPVDKAAQKELLEEVSNALYLHLNDLRPENCYMPNTSGMAVYFEKDGLKYSRDIFFSTPPSSSLDISVFKDTETGAILVQQDFPFRQNQLQVIFVNGKISQVLVVLDAGTEKSIAVTCH